MLRLLGDKRDALDARRSGADRTDNLAGEIDPLIRPQAGVVLLPLIIVDTGDLREARRRQITRRHNAEWRGNRFAMLGRDGPKIAVAVEVRRGDPCVQLHIMQEVKTLRDMVDIFQYFRLRTVPFRPSPFLLEIVIEGIGILHAFHVAAASGIAVPEPGSADPVSGLIGANLQALPAKRR